MPCSVATLADPAEVVQQRLPALLVELGAAVVAVLAADRGQHQGRGVRRDVALEDPLHLGNGVVVGHVQQQRGEPADGLQPVLREHGGHRVGLRPAGSRPVRARWRAARPRASRRGPCRGRAGDPSRAPRRRPRRSAPRQSVLGLGHEIRTSSMRTGRCSFWDRSHASAIQSASSPSATVQGEGRCPVDDLEERLELRAERRLEAVHEEPVRLPRRERDPGLGGADGPALVHPGGDAVLRAVDLEPHVVAAAVVAGVGDDAEGAVREGHDRGGGVGVVVVLEELRALVGAGGVDLDGLLAGDEPDDVEVVHPAVAVHPAGHRHVLRRRRLRVHGGGADRVDPAQLAALDGRLRRRDRRVVAALEPDLHRHGRALEAAEQLGSSETASVGGGSAEAAATWPPLMADRCFRTPLSA